MSLRGVAGIYKLTCTTTGQFYIGASADLAARKSMHFTAMRRGYASKAIKRLVGEHGIDCFSWDIVQTIDPGPHVEKRLADLEFSWINEALRLTPELLLNKPNAYYPGTGGKTQEKSFAEFRFFCSEQGIPLARALEEAFGDYIAKVGKHKNPAPGTNHPGRRQDLG